MPDPTIQTILSTVNVSENDINSIISSLKNEFKTISITNIVDSVISLMKLVGKLKQLSGSDKKFLVTQLIIFLIKETDIGTIDEISDSILINIVPTIIDKLISVENGELKINPKVNCGCFSFLTKN